MQILQNSFNLNITNEVTSTKWHKTLGRKITNNFWKSILLSWAKVIDSISKIKTIMYSIALFGIIRPSQMSPYSIKTGIIKV